MYLYGCVRGLGDDYGHDREDDGRRDAEAVEQISNQPTSKNVNALFEHITSHSGLHRIASHRMHGMRNVSRMAWFGWQLAWFGVGLFCPAR